MTIEQRIEKLEQELTETKAQGVRAKRRNRYLLAAGGLCLAIGLVAWAFGAGNVLAQPAATAPKRAKEVRAKEFILQDATGKARGGLLVDNKDGVRLRMDDEKGKAQAKFDVDKEGASLALEVSEKAGTTSATLQVLEDGTPWAVLQKKGKSGAWLNVDKDTARLLLLDEKGNPRAGLDAGENQVGWMHLDKRGNPVAWVSVDRGMPDLSLRRARVREGVSLQVAKNMSWLVLKGENWSQNVNLNGAKNSANLWLGDLTGDWRVTFSVGQFGPGLAVYGQKDKCIWSAP